MDIAKVALEFVKALLAWPVAAVIIALVFLKQLRALLDGLRFLLDRVNKVNAFNVSVDLGQQLLNEAKPTPEIEPTSTGISLSVSSGAYSTDYRAIFLVAGIANPTDQPDQMVSWKLSFPTLGIELEPTPAPNNLIGGVPWWPSPMVKVPTNELTQGHCCPRHGWTQLSVVENKGRGGRETGVFKPRSSVLVSGSCPNQASPRLSC
jgi:hypothetical protein